MFQRFCFILILFVSTQSFATLKVLLDAGHGGHDQGAVNAHLHEAKIALNITKKLGRILESDKDFKVYYTRKDNKFLSLDQRAKLTKKYKADVFVSIHLNSSPDKKARGKEIFFQNLLPPDEESLYLAKLENEGKAQHADEEEYQSDLDLILKDLQKNHKALMSSQLSEALHNNWVSDAIQRQRPIRQAPFRVISITDIPSVLVEVGYLSNSKESQLLKTESYQAKLASGMYAGLKEYKELVDKQSLRNLD